MKRRTPTGSPRRSAEPTAAQLSFDAIASGSRTWPLTRSLDPPQPRKSAWIPAVLAEFERRARAAGKSRATAASQMRSVRSMLKSAMRRRGHRVEPGEFFRNAALMADAACDDGPLDGRGARRVSLATLAGRRIAVRSFARLMEDVTGVAAEELIEQFEAELRLRYRLSGQTYRPVNGRSGRRERYIPGRDDIAALLRYVSRSGWAFYGIRLAALIHVLIATGMRISSVMGIRGEDFRRSGGRLTVFVREKARHEEGEYLVPSTAEQALQRYVDDRNRLAAERSLTNRIGIGVPGEFWTCADGGPWTAQAATEAIRKASAFACTASFGPHALRHFRARELVAEGWSRGFVSEVVGWEGTLMLDRHYGPRPGETLARPGAPDRQTAAGGRTSEAAS